MLENIPPVNVPSMETLNGTVLEIDEEAQTGKFKFEPTKAMCNPRGLIQGGFLSAMLDDAGGITCYLLSRREFTTSNLAVTFFYGANPGEGIVATAKIVRMGLRQAVIDAELIREEDGKLIARATLYQTFLDTQKKP